MNQLLMKDPIMNPTIKSHSYLFLTLCVGAALLLSSVGRCQAGPLLKDGDVVVFLGDESTEVLYEKFYEGYPHYVAQFLTLRYPELKLTFRNMGILNGTLNHGICQAKTAVPEQKASLVSVCYGINEAFNAPTDPVRLDQYRIQLNQLMDRFAGVGNDLVSTNPVPVLLLTYPPENRDALTSPMNTRLKEFAKIVVDVANQRKAMVFDSHAMLYDIWPKVRADTPKFTINRSSWFPGKPSSVVLAYGFLKALGGVENAPNLAVDATNGRITSERCTVKDLKVTADSVSFTRTDEGLPVYLDPDLSPLLKELPIIAEELNRYELRVTGLASGNWKLAVGGEVVGIFSGDDLAKGVNLADLPGPWRKVGEEINRSVIADEQLWNQRWMAYVASLQLPPETKAEWDALCGTLDALLVVHDQERRELVLKNRTQNWAIIQEK